MMTNKTNTTFYIGVTSNLIARVGEHKDCKYPSSFILYKVVVGIRWCTRLRSLFVPQFCTQSDIPIVDN